MEDLTKMRLCANDETPCSLTDERGRIRVHITYSGSDGEVTDDDKNLAIEVLQRFNNYGRLARDLQTLRYIIAQNGIDIACRVCGCTESRACEGGCYWIEPDLCSACEGVEKTGEDGQCG